MIQTPNRWFQLWYYLAIVVDAVVLFYFLSSNVTCFGEVSERCGDVNELGTLTAVGLAIANTVLARWKYKGYLSFGFTWQGDRTFPASFIPFFVFGAVFLGEHLPVIIGMLAGRYSLPGAKPSPLDLGGLGDVGVVFVIFAVFGTILWLLFRFVSWPVVFLGGATLGALAEGFLFVHREAAAGGADWVSNPLAAILGAVTVWGILSLVPYSLFRQIDRRWGVRGRQVAIAVVLLLNVLSLGFFAYQKYVVGLVNYEASGLPIGICPDRLVDQVGQPTVAYLNGLTIIKLEPGAHDWIQTHCPGVLERIE